jgi:acetyl esterase/lipase
MKIIYAFVLAALSTSPVLAQRPERTSENTPKLKQLLEERPELDRNRDGILTLSEARQSRNRKDRNPRAAKPAPTHADVSYGPHPSMQLDFWKAESDGPAPLFVFIHGGGFRSGDKASLSPALLAGLLKAGVSVASINYRLSDIGPYPLPMHDSARAVQFLRSKEEAWHIDPARVAAGGGSAGSGISQWLAFHDDLKNPDSSDPVEHCSTRLCSALALSMQSTYDPRVIRKIIPGDAYKDRALKPFYGLPVNWDWDTADIDARLDALIRDASPINHLSADDPPVFIFHAERTRKPANIHHPKFGEHLEEAMKKLGIEAIRRTDADYESTAALNDDIVQFVLRHFEQPGSPGN